MKWITTIFVVMILLSTGIVIAEDSTEDATDYTGRSLDLRYENLVCKIDYTIGQINVIDKYATLENITENDSSLLDRLMDDKDTLSDDKDDLKDVYDEDNVTLFNDFVSDTLYPDFNDTMYDLRGFKDNYKIYVASEDQEDFRDALVALRDEYQSCTDTRYTEMSKLMDQYYKHKAGMWDQIIKSMDQRGLSTEEMEQVKAQLEERLADLEDAMNSGDSEQIREQLELMREEHLHLWARFHSGRLNSYLNRIEPAANQYGKSEEVKKIRAQLDDIESLIAQGNAYKRGDVKTVMQTLHDSADEMRDMGKGMLKQRVQEKTNGNSGNSNGNSKKR